MKKFFTLVTLFVPLLLALLIPHTTQAQFLEPTTAQETISLQGQIADFSFRSPASSISIVVSDRDGVNNWTIEAPSATVLRRLGWDSSSLFTGEIVRLQARTLPNLPYQAELISITRANGALLLAGASQGSTHLDLTAIPSGLYSLDTDHAYMLFSYNHKGFSRPQLRFQRFSASLNIDTTRIEDTDVRVEVDVSSLSSGVAALDDVLRGQAFFDSLNHPRISFRSNAIALDAWGHAKVTGELEIKGQAQQVTLDAQLNSAGFNPDTNMYTLGVSITGQLLRSEWDMGQDQGMASDRIQIQIEAEFIQPAR